MTKALWAAGAQSVPFPGKEGGVCMQGTRQGRPCIKPGYTAPVPASCMTHSADTNSKQLTQTKALNMHARGITPLVSHMAQLTFLVTPCTRWHAVTCRGKSCHITIHRSHAFNSRSHRFLLGPSLSFHTLVVARPPSLSSLSYTSLVGGVMRLARLRM